VIARIDPSAHRSGNFSVKMDISTIAENEPSHAEEVNQTIKT
jgi:hypothetical protein